MAFRWKIQRKLPVTGRLAVHNTSASVIYRAGWVVCDPWTIYPNGFVHVANGLIREVGSRTGAGAGAGHIPTIDCGDGVIFPALVNAHTHLELSALKGSLSTENGFTGWVQELLRKRELLTSDDLLTAATSALAEMIASGCGAVGDISTLGTTWNCLRNSGMSGVWFHEFLGSRIPDIAIEEAPHHDLRMSLAGHAPHTTAPDVLKAIKTRLQRRHLPFSIHLAESAEEVQFLKTASGKWKDFLMSRGIDPASWGLPAPSPVRYMQRTGILDPQTILVHVLHADGPDMDIIRGSGAHICICPRSNMALHQRLPDLTTMLKTGVRLCIGTDSLASVESLNLLDEMRFISLRFPAAPPATIFEMATCGGAQALGIDAHLGSLTPGKMGKLAYSPARASRASDVLNTIIHNTTTS